MLAPVIAEHKLHLVTMHLSRTHSKHRGVVRRMRSKMPLLNHSMSMTSVNYRLQSTWGQNREHV